MVVFTCNHCGDAVQKPKVEKHYTTKCRRPKDLTCVDCLNDFRDEAFAVHTACLSEDQRYSAKGTEQKPMKGLQKQGDWVDVIRSCYDSEPDCKKSKLQTVFEAILGQANIPRKKGKFMNFLTSTMGNRVNKDDASEVFDLIQNYYVKQQNMKAASVKNDEKANKVEKEDDLSENETKEMKKSKENGEVKSVEIADEEKPKEIDKRKKKNRKRKNGNSEVDNGKKPKLDNSASKKIQNDIPVGTEASKITSESASLGKKNKKRNKAKNKSHNIIHAVENGVEKATKNKNNIDSDNLTKPIDVGSSDVNDEAITSKSMKRRMKHKEKVQKKINDLENIPKIDEGKNATPEKNKKVKKLTENANSLIQN